MKKLISIALVLFILHTIEETLFQFWNTDTLTLWASGLTSLQPLVVYWIGQVLLYIFLLLLLLIPTMRALRWAQVLLGVLMFFEFEHLFVVILSHHYETGLISGAMLAIFSLFYFFQIKDFDQIN